MAAVGPTNIQQTGVGPLASGANNLAALFAEVINQMSAEEFEKRLKQSSLKELMAIVNNPNVSSDKKMAALDTMMDAIQASKSADSDTIGGDEETPEEKLKALLEMLKSKLTNGGTMTAADSAQINAATQAVATSQNTASAAA